MSLRLLVDIIIYYDELVKLILFISTCTDYSYIWLLYKNTALHEVILVIKLASGCNILYHKITIEQFDLPASVCKVNQCYYCLVSIVLCFAIIIFTSRLTCTYNKKRVVNSLFILLLLNYCLISLIPSELNNSHPFSSCHSMKYCLHNSQFGYYFR